MGLGEEKKSLRVCVVSVTSVVTVVIVGGDEMSLRLRILGDATGTGMVQLIDQVVPVETP